MWCSHCRCWCRFRDWCLFFMPTSVSTTAESQGTCFSHHCLNILAAFHWACKSFSEIKSTFFSPWIKEGWWNEKANVEKKENGAYILIQRLKKYKVVYGYLCQYDNNYIPDYAYVRPLAGVPACLASLNINSAILASHWGLPEDVGYQVRSPLTL